MSAVELLPTAARPYVLEDWMGKRVLPLETFDTFDTARGRVSELANAEAERVGGTEDERESTYNGVCEDLYAERRYVPEKLTLTVAELEPGDMLAVAGNARTVATLTRRGALVRIDCTDGVRTSRPAGETVSVLR